MKALLNFLLSFIRFFFNLGEMGSFQIDTAFVEGFKNNIYILSQQTMPRLFNHSRMESQSSEDDSYERIGVSEANTVIDRHGDTPINNTPHSRRRVSLQDADWGDLIDNLDRVRLLIRPDDAYVKTAVMALNRRKDDIFIAAALGIARAGKQGTINIPLPIEQKIVAVADDGSGASRFNLYTLTLMQEKFDSADIDEADMMKRYFAWSGKVKQQLLNDTKATSSDFATVKALVNGQIMTFMGFDFKRSERLPLTSAATNFNPVTGEVLASGGSVLAAGARRCFAWVEDGMISATGLDLFVDIGPRRDKRMSTQIYAQHSVGAVRMEEVKVCEVIVDESL